MKKKKIQMTREEYLEKFNYYNNNHFIPEDRIRDYMEMELSGEIEIIK